MARETHRREDLLRDATALSPRGVLRRSPDDGEGEIFVGFRGEAASIFFGEAPVFHFNAAGQLRRAYIGDRLIKAEGGRLISLERRRATEEVSLVRHDLTDSEQELLLDGMEERLQWLRAAIGDGSVSIASVHPAGADLAAELNIWFQRRATRAVARKAGL